MNKPMILIVEDRPELRLLEEGALRGAGYETQWTDAIQEAARRVETGKVALLILDVDKVRDVPGGPPLREWGLAFLKRLRASPPPLPKRLPVIATTIHIPPTEESYEQTVMDAGADAFFEQPIDLEELVKKVEQLIS